MTLPQHTAPLPQPVAESRRKSFTLDHLKLATDGEPDGTFTGIASAVGVLDRHGEIIERGAFDTDLATNGGRRVLLWQHNPSQPIGVIDLSTDQRGDLVAKGTINLDTQLGREAYSLLKQGAINAMSIGFNIPEGGVKWDDESKVLRILSVTCWETSLVTFPANPGALVDGVKHDADQLDTILATTDAILARVKAGRVLSAANRSKLEAAIAACQAVLDADTPPVTDSIGPPPAPLEMGELKALITEMGADLDTRIRGNV